VIDLITRAEWHARSPKGAYTRVTSAKGVKVHYTGGRVDPRIVDDHRRCVDAVQAIQDHHMDGNGWLDIGYSMVGCPHRKVFVGRGAQHLCAANGPGLNAGHYAVLGLVGNAGLVVPPPGVLHAILDAIGYLREHGGAGKEIKGHRDGYPTECPGDQLYAWVKAGAPRPGSEHPTPPVPVEPPEFVRDLKVTKPFMEGNDIRQWQARAAEWGEHITVDGVYGPQSATVCRTVQRFVGIPATGVVDGETWLSFFIWEP